MRNHGKSLAMLTAGCGKSLVILIGSGRRRMLIRSNGINRSL